MSINLFQPFHRGRALLMTGSSCWVSFKYEKLPGFCFKCGCILHGPNGCSVQPMKKQSHAVGKEAWGTWLRAEDLPRGFGVPEEARDPVSPPPKAATAEGGEDRARVDPVKEKSQEWKEVHGKNIPVREPRDTFDPVRGPNIKAVEQERKERGTDFEREAGSKGNRKRKPSLESQRVLEADKAISNSLLQFELRNVRVSSGVLLE
jgi:hypothetical protein